MNIRTILTMSLLTACVSVVSCEKKTGQTTTSSDRTAPIVPATDTKADNTGRNKVDRDNTTKTPLDQSNASSDVRITADIRRAILDDKSMSTNAQNCKIITESSGVVTLRGPVASQAEKDSIEAKAKMVAGVNRVINELEVKSK